MEYKEIPDQISKLTRGKDCAEYVRDQLIKPAHARVTVEVCGRNIEVERELVVAMLTNSAKFDGDELLKLKEVSDILHKVANPLLQGIK